MIAIHKRLKLNLLLLILSILLPLPSFALNILLVNPDKPGRPFWDQATQVAQATADDLGIELEIKYAGGDRFSQEHLLKELKPEYDYVIFLPYKGKVVQEFQAITEKNIPFITLESSMDTREYKLIGSPQEKYPLWLAEVYYDDYQAGRILGASLINESKRRKHNKVNILAFNGDYSALSSERANGLINSTRMGNSEVMQIIHTMWDPATAQNQIGLALRRYLSTNVIWAASDELALAIQEKLPQEQQHIVIGGIDWVPAAIKAVANGKLTSTVGGHFMQAAWALIIAYDHSQGIDISQTRKHMPLQHKLINKENVERYNILLNSAIWPCANFKQFSLAFNPNQNDYQFNFERIISNTPTECSTEH